MKRLIAGILLLLVLIVPSVTSSSNEYILVGIGYDTVSVTIKSPEFVNINCTSLAPVVMEKIFSETDGITYDRCVPLKDGIVIVFRNNNVIRENDYVIIPPVHFKERMLTIVPRELEINGTRYILISARLDGKNIVNDMNEDSILINSDRTPILTYAPVSNVRNLAYIEYGDRDAALVVKINRETEFVANDKCIYNYHNDSTVIICESGGVLRFPNPIDIKFVYIKGSAGVSGANTLDIHVNKYGDSVKGGEVEFTELKGVHEIHFGVRPWWIEYFYIGLGAITTTGVLIIALRRRRSDKRLKSSRGAKKSSSKKRRKSRAHRR